MTGTKERPTVPNVILAIFWAQIALVLAYLGLLAAEETGIASHIVDRLFSAAFAPFGVAFFILGLALLILSWRTQLPPRLRTFLILTGAASSTAVIGAILHNVFYAIGIVARGWPIIEHISAGLEVAFFLAAVIGCPALFVIGAVGSIANLIRGHQRG
jgi:hypothetical protein